MQIFPDARLSNILWYQLGGTTRYLIEVKSKKDIYQALEFVSEKNIKKIFFCGLGSNLIFSDDYYDGAVIRITTEPNATDTIQLKEPSIIEAFAGSLLDHVINYGFRHNISGLEWAGGLPGTVGAAVRGNVGAFGGELKDSLYAAEILDISGSEPAIKTLANKECNFVYRGSIIKESLGKMIVLSALFTARVVSHQELEQARAKYHKSIQFRKDHHPLEYPSCGSVFKNIKDKNQIEKVLSVFPDIQDSIVNKWHGKVAVGYLIQRLGLQGLRIGNAQISDKHALFIVNLGGAQARDVLLIIQTVQQKFQETFGFSLEPEVEIVQ